MATLWASVSKRRPPLIKRSSDRRTFSVTVRSPMPAVRVLGRALGWVSRASGAIDPLRTRCSASRHFVVGEEWPPIVAGRQIRPPSCCAEPVMRPDLQCGTCSNRLAAHAIARPALGRRQADRGIPRARPRTPKAVQGSSPISVRQSRTNSVPPRSGASAKS